MDQLINFIALNRPLFMHLALVVVLLAVLLASVHYLLGKRKWYGYGKVLGFILGFAIARGPGALIGILFGHVFDILVQPKVIRRPTQRTATVTTQQEYDYIYFDTLFACLGDLASASGQVNTSHLNQFNAIVASLSLSSQAQRNAWEWFQFGQHKDFNLRQALFAFTQMGYGNPQRQQYLLQQVITYANAIQPLNNEQYAILCAIAHALNISTESFSHLAPKGEKARESSREETATLSNPYKVLGIKKEASAKEVKWAYRKLMGKYHPDKLISKDLPEDLLEFATKRTQQIKDAYEKICNERGI